MAIRSFRKKIANQFFGIKHLSGYLAISRWQHWQCNLVSLHESPSVYLFILQIVRQSDNDQVTVVAACVTLDEALKAAKELSDSGINIRVVDPFTIKPIDAATIIHCAKATGGRIITVEDHYPEGKH